MLNGRQREIVQAISVEGASIREAAARFGISEGATRVALHRGLAALAAAYRSSGSMRTDDLIWALAEDHAARPRPAPVGRVFGLAFVLGLALPVGLFAVAMGLRPDFAAVVSSSWRFDLKLLVALGLSVSAASLVLRSARPAGRPGLRVLSLAAAPLLLAAAVGLELYLSPQSAWAAKAIGNNALPCVISVIALSAAPLAAALYALRRGASPAPGFTGALAGLLSSGLAAALYGTHCTDDSPLFVAAWYTVGVAVVTLAGMMIGRRVLRW